jgi:hypothetical protein
LRRRRLHRLARKLDYKKPDLAPPTVLAEDGTTLHRYKLVGVVYARTRVGAQLHVDLCDQYLDGLRIDSPEPVYPPRGYYGRKMEDVPLPELEE